MVGKATFTMETSMTVSSAAMVDTLRAIHARRSTASNPWLDDIRTPRGPGPDLLCSAGR